MRFDNVIGGKHSFTDKKIRTVQPIGFIHTQGEVYFLLNLKPVQGDWENVLERRFVVVPIEEISDPTSKVTIYSFARHLVTNSYTIEYHPNIAPISIWNLGDIDLSAIEEEEQKDCENEEPDWQQLELTDMIRSMEESNG